MREAGGAGVARTSPDATRQVPEIPNETRQAGRTVERGTNRGELGGHLLMRPMSPIQRSLPFLVAVATAILVSTAGAEAQAPQEHEETPVAAGEAPHAFELPPPRAGPTQSARQARLGVRYMSVRR